MSNPLISSTDGLAELFTNFSPDQRFALLIISMSFGLGLVLGLAGIVSSTVSSIHRRRTEMEMKRDLLDRGMSAEEISQIIESTQPKDFLERWAAAARKTK